MGDSTGVVEKDEIIRILKEAATSNSEVSMNLASAELEILQVNETKLVIGLRRQPKGPSAFSTVISKHMLFDGAAVEVVFSHAQGQFAIRDNVRDLTDSTFTVDAGHSLIRLQRRQDFRVSVKHRSMKFIWSQRDPAVVHIPLSLIDLSAGGLRVLWSPQAGETPRTHQKLSGQLILREGKDELALSVTLVFVKNHGPESPLKPELGDAVSFKFEPLSQDDARTLLFTCVGVARSIYGSR